LSADPDCSHFHDQETFMKRYFLILLSLLGLSLQISGFSQTKPPSADEFRVTLLGTGSPAPVMRRFGPGVLVQAGGKNLVIDAGRGVTQRLLQSGLRLGQVDAMLLTHLHSDHVVGLPDLWLTGWLESGYAQRKGPFVVYGPKGTQNLMDGLTRAYDWDIKARIADQNLDPASIQSTVTEIKEGVVYEQGGDQARHWLRLVDSPSRGRA
jgi:ribonuclease Z